MGKETVEERYQWMPDWAKQKYHDCPIFQAVILVSSHRGLDREQTLWLLCETLCKDRDGWKKQTMDLIKSAPHPIMVKLEELQQSLK